MKGAKILAEKWKSHTYSIGVGISNGEVKITQDSYQGLSCRAFDKTFGFACTNNPNMEKEVENKAKRLAQFGTGKEKYRMKIMETNRSRVPVSEAVFKEYDAGSVAKELAELDKLLVDPAISSRSIGVRSNYTIREYENSSGAHVVFKDVWSYFSASAVARAGDVMETWSEREGWLGRLDSKDISSFSSMAETTRKKAVSLLTAGHVKKGSYTVVLDPDMAGVFAHEAVGHACEADSVLGKASVLDKIGAKVGSSIFNIVDYSSHPQGFGNIEYDDEGVKARPALLIEKGVLKGYMHDSLTSTMMGAGLTGNARSEGYSSPPIIRMRNTVLEPSDRKKAVKDEEVMNVKEGIFLKGMNGGSVDPLNGTFMFSAKEAYIINKGEMGGHLRDVAISSNIKHTLKNITSVGRDVSLSPGFCGKEGQHVRVSDGGPVIRVEDMTVG